MVNIAVIISIKTKEFPRICSASSLLSSPSLMEVRAAPPIPTSIEKAIIMVIKGKVTPRPAKASSPTPLPTNILSIILYKAFTSIPTIAGIEYLSNNMPTLSFLSSSCRFICFPSLHSSLVYFLSSFQEVPLI